MPNQSQAAPSESLTAAALVAVDSRGVRAGSFTRFLLPLPYRLTALCESAGSMPLVFEEASNTKDWLHAPGEDSPDKGRRDYLTRETRETLHSAATWMVLRGKAEGRGGAQGVDWSKPDSSFDFRFHSLAGRIVRFRIRPPGLILLEQSPDCGPGCAASRCFVGSGSN